MLSFAVFFVVNVNKLLSKHLCGVIVPSYQNMLQNITNIYQELVRVVIGIININKGSFCVWARPMGEGDTYPKPISRMISGYPETICLMTHLLSERGDSLPANFDNYHVAMT